MLMTGERGTHALLLAFGFEEEFFDYARPPATHYHLSGETSGFFAEFLTPLVGSEYDRKQKRKTVMEVAGASTRQMRHIDLLLTSPWSINVEHAELSARIRIGKPGSLFGPEDPHSPEARASGSTKGHSVYAGHC
jgi:hypothetical protein